MPAASPIDLLGSHGERMLGPGPPIEPPSARDSTDAADGASQRNVACVLRKVNVLSVAPCGTRRTGSSSKQLSHAWANPTKHPHLNGRGAWAA